MPDNYLWKASLEKIKDSNLYKFCEFLEKKIDLPLFENYHDLWRWSVESPEVFGMFFGIFL